MNTPTLIESGLSAVALSLNGGNYFLKVGIAFEGHLFGLPTGFCAPDAGEVFKGLFYGLFAMTTIHPFNGQERGHNNIQLGLNGFLNCAIEAKALANNQK